MVAIEPHERGAQARAGMHEGRHDGWRDRCDDGSDDDGWMADAACKGRTALFFAPRAERPQARVRREAQARQLCMQCSVRAECRAFARVQREYGFWGGESEEERHLAGFTVAAPIGVRARGLGLGEVGRSA